jgi:hypothetical protein
VGAAARARRSDALRPVNRCRRPAARWPSLIWRFQGILVSQRRSANDSRPPSGPDRRPGYHRGAVRRVV